MEKPLVNKTLLLQKYPGKGGWTFAVIPGISKENRGKFGLVKVKGSIDDFYISKYSLMPMGDGNLFLPVRAEIRKKIKKEEGDHVRVVLYPDNGPTEVPEELLLCLKEEPSALQFFKTLSASEQNLYVKWIYSAKKEETKIDRIAKTINRLCNKQKLFQTQ